MWQEFLLCHGAQSSRLRDAVADLACFLANRIVNWMDTCALMSSRLIALDKFPGVRPIGIGEVLWRILGKVMMLITGVDVEEICGTDQLCSGLMVELKEQYIVYVIYMRIRQMKDMGCYLLMLKMHLIRSLEMLHFGM